MEFVLKHYRKKATIQLKPKTDISSNKSRCVHFSIAWFKTNDISKEQKREISRKLFEELCECLEKLENRLEFRIVKACENCTYGHFDKVFEDIVSVYREKYPLCTEKNLPLEQHPEVPQDKPIMFHIGHSISTDDNFNLLLQQKSNKTKTLIINVETISVNK